MPTIPNHNRCSSTGIFHIVNKGVNGRSVFLDDEDHRMFIRTLKAAKRNYPLAILAYCLMTNHYHLILWCKGGVPSAFIESFMSSFAHYYRNKYDSAGHIFKSHYSSTPIEDFAHIADAVRYVWRNPVRAGMCEDPCDYLWSSYQVLGKEDELIDNRLLCQIMTEREWRRFSESQCIYRHLEPDVSKPDDKEATDLLCRLFNISNPLLISKYPLRTIGAYCHLADQHDISKAQMCRITGMTRYMLDKAIKESDFCDSKLPLALKNRLTQKIEQEFANKGSL